MASALDTAGLLSLLDLGATVLLPTKAAARALRHRFDQRQRARGLHAWEPAAVLTWSEWTTSLWSFVTVEDLDDRVLLNRLQEEFLWTRVIEDRARANSEAWTSAEEQASLARSALSLAAAHLALDRLQNSADSFDSRIFALWQRQFAAECSRQRLLPAAMLETALVHHSLAIRPAVPDSIHLAGFGQLTPAQGVLLSALEKAGCSVSSHPLQHCDTAHGFRTSVKVGEPAEELRWAVQWIRHRYQSNPRPDASFALLLPDPAAERPELEAILRNTLAPELEPVGADLSSTPWQFSTGPELARVPLVQHALLLLGWLEGELPVERAGALLLSPFFSHGDSFEARARFEMHALRRSGLLRPELTLEEFLALGQGRKAQTSGALLALPEWRRLRQLIGDTGQLTGTGSNGDWAELVRKALRLVGWPGPRTLSPAEFRASEAWESLLDLLATVDLYGERSGYAAFLKRLQIQAHAVQAPSSSGVAPLQIGTLAELEGCCFDAALHLHTTEETLPSPERAHPLLGWRLQHSLGMPGTDPALASFRSREAVRSLSGRCRDLLLTYAAEDGNGALRPSPLIGELGFKRQEAACLVPPPPPRVQVKALSVRDDAPLPPLPSTRIQGGARVLELQAACGFRAFASQRLQASAPEESRLGLDARSRGTLLHNALANLWRDLKSRQALQALTVEERKITIRDAVALACAASFGGNQAVTSWSESYRNLVQKQLAALLFRWLKLESERSEFTVVAPERQQNIQIGPLDLSVRPDRIDRVERGFVFVDYKTSLNLSAKDWLGERPDAPQLPLYALLAEAAEFQGIAFARVRPGESMAWIALTEDPALFPGTQRRPETTLAEQMLLWRAELEQLAHAFAEGETDVNPKQYPATCQYCDQRLLCRVSQPFGLGQEQQAAARVEENELG